MLGCRPHRIHLRRPIVANIERYCPQGLFSPPGYSQGVKVTNAQTILFLAGQVPYVGP